MANVIRLRNGLDISLKGKAEEVLFTVENPELYALVPDDFHGVTPKVIVKPEEGVKVGTPLFYDKKNPEVKFVSPVSGVVTAVERGARRKVLNVTVRPSKEQEFIDFGKKDVDKLSKEEVKSIMLETGLFGFVKERPYDVVANPNNTPKAIFVSGFDSNPLAGSFEFKLKGDEKNFQTGLNVLAKLAKTYLTLHVNQSAPALKEARNVVLNYVDGPHPAGNVGVQINHIDPINKGEIVWTVKAEAVIFIGRLFNTGKLDFTRTVAFVGSEVDKPSYCKLILGAQLTKLFKGRVTKDKNLRYISGSVLTGTQISKDGFLGATDSIVSVIPEGDDAHELFGWILPRTDQFSVNRSYFSWLQGNKEYALDARLKGGKRHMIFSNEYDKVLPMNIFPEFLIKAILAGDIDRMEELGVYEIAPEDFALCEFVCSSKVELQKIVRNGLDMLRAEMS
ncbi:Na(+)-translocating NADH-quinone reductase subunit A [Bacteroides propionicifaciens]|uniref:Na(+)-translocating NADH-quinone reductase subunit A n=1 Tax=Bacteroides propionicifaciens TaxID=392838 RepID=UPI00036C170B|nr:Na(+)-translocating NADH-quinone reductase subunit A [Bacteroides propionicifaciens]